jgi:hypothetical protein
MWLEVLEICVRACEDPYSIAQGGEFISCSNLIIHIPIPAVISAIIVCICAWSKKEFLLVKNKPQSDCINLGNCYSAHSMGANISVVPKY